MTIAYEVSIDQQYGYGVCCKLVLKYYDYILLLLFVVKEWCSFVIFSKLVSAVNTKTLSVLIISPNCAWFDKKYRCKALGSNYYTYLIFSPYKPYLWVNNNKVLVEYFGWNKQNVVKCTREIGKKIRKPRNNNFNH